MASHSLHLICIVLLLSAVSRAQEAAGNAEQPPVPAAESPEQPAPNPAPEETVKPPETEAKLPAVPVDSPPIVVEEKNAPTVTEIELAPALPAAGADSPPIPLEGEEDPKIAAKQIEGGVGLDKTPLIAEPDAIKKVLGSRCTSDKDCLEITNTECINKVCICKTGFIASKHSMDKCLKVPTGLGDECEEEAQCSQVVPNSECRSNKCDCPPNHVFDQNRCWEKKGLGGFCNITLQCDDIMFSACEQNVCACEAPLIPSPENKCLQPATRLYQAPCVEDIQCTYSYGDESRCHNYQCKCTNNYHYNGTTCIPDKKLGEVCEIHDDCAVSESNNSEGSRICLANSCSCADGYKTLPGEEICTRSAGEELAVSLTWILCIVVAKYYLA